MKRNILNRLITAYVLLLSVLLSSVSGTIPVFSIEPESDIDNEIVFDNTTEGSVDPNSSIIDNLEAEQVFFLSANDCPEPISLSEAQAKGHVKRLREKEPDNNTVVFLNNDNTETMYLFAEPVKYTDNTGAAKDKSTALSISSAGYAMENNDINTVFPTDIATGVSVSKGGSVISMAPQATLTHASDAIEQNNKVFYRNVFGNGTVLAYTPLLSGVKEDIILTEYNGQTEFSFTVNTNGLYIVKNENGSCSFCDPETNEIIAEMAQVVCYDSVNAFAGGDVVITEITANQLYTVTVIADVDFLTSQETVYPVYIDPTINMSGTTDIEDAVIYSGYPNNNFGDYLFNTIGYLDTSYKEGELLLRFPNLADNTVFESIEPERVVSANYSMYTASNGTGTETIKTYRLRYETWSESTVKWSTLSFLNPPVLVSTTTVPAAGGQAINIDITSAVRIWASEDVSSTPENGLILVNGSTTDATKARDFASTEYASGYNSAYIPKIQINYISSFMVFANQQSITLKKGATTVCSGYMLVDGSIQYNNGTLLTFSSLDPTIATVHGQSGAVTGIKAGKTKIKLAYSSDPNIYALIDVTILDSSDQIVDNNTYIINNDIPIVNSRSCDINARLKKDGVLLDNDEEIVYEIIKNPFASDPWYIPATINSAGVLSYTIPEIDMPFAHPTGIFKIKAYKAGDETISKTITVEVVCDDLDQTQGSYLTPLTHGRMIRVDYPFDGDNSLSANNAFLLQQLLNFYEDNSFEDINTSFTKEDNGWIQYDDSENNRYEIKLLELIRTSRIVFINTHGSPCELSVNSNANMDLSNNPNDYLLTTDDILAMHDGYFGYCDLIVILACDSATEIKNSENDVVEKMSIAEAFWQKGAKCVIGFNEKIDLPDVHQFQATFIYSITEKYNNNGTIHDAVESAKTVVSTIEDSIVCFGDTAQRFND